MAELSIETEVALLKQSSASHSTMLDKHDNIIIGLITTVQDLKTKFYVLGVAFPFIISVVGLMQSFGVFSK